MTIVLLDPLYAHNVSQVCRNAEAFGDVDVRVIGHRWLESGCEPHCMAGCTNPPEPSQTLPSGAWIAIERHPDAIPLPMFKHTHGNVYLFGPEDGHIPEYILKGCRAIVSIPTTLCLNLATSVATVLYDKEAKAYHDQDRI